MIKPRDNVLKWVGSEVTMDVAEGYQVQGMVLCIDEEEIKGYVDWVDENYQSWEFLCDLDICESIEDKRTQFKKDRITDILNELKNKSYISFLKNYYMYHINTRKGGFRLITYDDFRFLVENRLVKRVSDVKDLEWFYVISYKGLNFKWS